MPEVGLLGQLGIDWKLFLSQVFNFAILLAVLWQFVYKPLLVVIKKRNEKIEEGLKKAAEADVRLHEIDVITASRLKKTDEKSMAMIKATEERAKKLEELLVKKAEEKQQQLLIQAQVQYEKQQEESHKKVLAAAAGLIKRLMVKTVELKPDAIDDALIEKAIGFVKHEI